MSVIRIEKLECVYVNGLLNVGIKTDAGTDIVQTWKLDVGFTEASYIELANLFSNTPCVDSVMVILEESAEQVSGPRLYESVESLGLEGLLDDITSKVKNFFKRADKFGNFNVREAGSLIKAIEANIDKTIKNDKWLEENYSANGQIEIDLSMIGSTKDVQPDNWIDKLIANQKVAETYHSRTAKEVQSVSNHLVDLADKMLDDKPENLSKHLAKLKSAKSIADVLSGDKPYEYEKAKLEVNCPSAEYLAKLGDVFVKATKSELGLYDVYEQDLAPEHVLLDLHDASKGYDESDAEAYYLEFARKVNMEDFDLDSMLGFGMFVHDLIKTITKKGKK